MRDVQHFDLNIEQVLEHWTVAHGIRELIANAIDEAMLTGTGEPQILQEPNNIWCILDGGRGLRHEHLTQNENDEKLMYPDVVIGKFGVGLKDALATFDRHGVQVTIESRHLHMVTDRAAKSGFADIITLHAMIGPPRDPHMVGTTVTLRALPSSTVDLNASIHEARSFFLRYSGEEELERTRYGSVVATTPGQLSRIYVNGLRVAEEPQFLFSYNITSLTAPLRRALNRERTNVGRSVYSERVKSILLECQTARVAQALARDLGNAQRGTMHDELQWTDVALHASRILNATGQVLFVTTEQLLAGGSSIQRAQDEGLQVIAVPGNVAARFTGMTDIGGAPLRDLAVYHEEQRASFRYAFVAPEDLTPSEQAVFRLTPDILRLVRARGTQRVRGVFISETMRTGPNDEETLGVWEEGDERIIIRRSVLASREQYCGVLLHELAHAVSWSDDLTFPFELTLTHFIGTLAVQALAPAAVSVAVVPARVAATPAPASPVSIPTPTPAPASSPTVLPAFVPADARSSAPSQSAQGAAPAGAYAGQRVADTLLPPPPPSLAPSPISVVPADVEPPSQKRRRFGWLRRGDDA